MTDPLDALQRMRLAGFQVEADHHGGLRVHPDHRLSAEQRAFVEANRHTLECAVLREALRRQSQAMREAAAEMAEMRSDLDDYRDLVMVLEKRLEALQGRRRAGDGTASGEISGEMLRRLIQLCHPDRHGGSDAARKATTFLLSLREPPERSASGE